jgi:preprotein translocase subunit SecE
MNIDLNTTILIVILLVLGTSYIVYGIAQLIADWILSKRKRKKA